MIPLVSVVIINYNTPDLVNDCVASLRQHLAVEHEIIIVESGLDRPLPNSSISKWGAIHLPSAERRGFGKANNLGAQRARGRFLWLLNSDTIIPDARVNDLFSLLDRHPDVGIATPVLFCDRNLDTRQPGFYSYFQSFRSLLIRELESSIDWDSSALPEIISCDKVTGAAMVISAELFHALGGFDERYFMYMEDDDLCFRAKLRGAKSGIATRCAVVHLQGKSISAARERKCFYYESQTLFWKTHRGPWATWLMRTLRLPKRVLNG